MFCISQGFKGLDICRSIADTQKPMKVLERSNTALGVIDIEVPVANQRVEGLLLKRE